MAQDSRVSSRVASDTVVAEARDVKVVFPGDEGPVVAVRGFSLKIHRGEIVGLVGSIGSGKSVASRTFLGLVQPPGKMVEGETFFMGESLTNKSLDELRNLRGDGIGLILQDPHAALNPLVRVGEQIVNVYRAHRDASRREAKEHAVDMLRLTGINDPERRFSAYPQELSGGMAQRVVIAMGLCLTPKLLIADEPTSALDVTIQAQVLDDLGESVRATGSAVLLIAKDLGVIANYCDRVIVMYQGTPVERGLVKTVFHSPQHHFTKAMLSLQLEAREVDLAPRATPEDNGAGGACATPLLEVDGLTKIFPVRGSAKGLQAVKDVTFSINEGETLGLVGESGSGKTTTGRCLLRLEDPTSGEIRYRGESIGSIPLHDLRRYRSNLQIVFQNPFLTLNPRWSVGRAIKEPLDLHADSLDSAKRDRVFALMQLVGLEGELVDSVPRELTAGRKQRVAIARAIATNPDFIVLDEPTSALPPDAESEIIHLLMDLQERLGLAYLFISHDLTTVKHICHRVAVMYLSQIVEIGTKRQVFTDPQHPYSRALLASVLFPDATNRRIDRPAEERRVLTGEIPSPIDLPRGCYLYGRCPVGVDACRNTPQVLRPLDDGRLVRCWRVIEGDLDPAADPFGIASVVKAQ